MLSGWLPSYARAHWSASLWTPLVVSSTTFAASQYPPGTEYTFMGPRAPRTHSAWISRYSTGRVVWHATSNMTPQNVWSMWSRVSAVYASWVM